MEPLFIVILLLLIISVLLTFKLIRSIFKAILIALVLVIIILGVTTVLIVNDAKDFAQTFRNEPTTYVLLDGEEVIISFETLGLDLDSYEVVTDVKDATGKIIYVQDSILQKEVEGVDLDLLLESSEKEVQAQGFTLALANTISQEGPLGVLQLIRSKEIDITPRTLIIKFISSSPKQFAKDLVADIEVPTLDEIKEEVREYEFSK